MSKKKRLIGIQHIFVGEVLETGLMPDLSAMTEIGTILPDSASIAKEDDTVTDLKAQETGEVDISILSELGAQSAVFNTRDFNQTNLVLAFGGSMVNGKWNEPVDAFRGREKSVKIIGRSVDGLHFVVDMPKTKMTAKMIGELPESESASIQFTMKKLTPINETTSVKQSPLQKYSQPQAPSFGIVDDTAKSFLFDYVPSFEVATEYEYSTDGGSIWADVTVNPITGLTATAIGDLLVRVKAVVTGDDQFTSGFALANTEAIT